MGTWVFTFVKQLGGGGGGGGRYWTSDSSRPLKLGIVGGAFR